MREWRSEKERGEIEGGELRGGGGRGRGAEAEREREREREEAELRNEGTLHFSLF